ncbi:MAG: hypothetical protein HDR88_05225 [Bacteroides sp.]|nr:hypothetical protein [Bacteroides sp.]
MLAIILTGILLDASAMENALAEERYYWITSIILGLVVFGTIILDLKGVIEKMRKRMNNRIKAVIRLRGIVDDNKGKISELQSNLNYLTLLHTEMIEKLFLLYYIRNKEQEIRNEALADSYSIVEKIIADEKFAEKLEYGINLRSDNVMVQFREDLPKLNDWEYELFLYYVAGFTARTIGLLMKVEPPTVHKRKANLKRKISESGCSNREKYLEWV